MARTVDEKLKYNQAQKTPFSTGYVIGVNLYRNYSKMNSEGKKTINETIQTCRELARKGDDTGKGFMCAMRDAANERKAKKNK